MAIPVAGNELRAAPALGDGTNGALTGGQLYLVGGVSIFSGNGLPGDNVNGGLAVVGEIYIRNDGGVGSTIYRCTVAAPGATWLAIL